MATTVLELLDWKFQNKIIYMVGFIFDKFLDMKRKSL